MICPSQKPGKLILTPINLSEHDNDDDEDDLSRILRPWQKTAKEEIRKTVSQSTGARQQNCSYMRTT